jgi:phosphoribosylformimino-5-aminoimidazole carboxamide ribotide isomerase
LFEQFTVIPSIDLKAGEVVRLWRGQMDRVTVYSGDAAAVASAFEAEGAQLIHVVDLDGAIVGAPQNLDAVRAIRAAVRCALDVSGGLRTADSVRDAFRAGADYVSIGTAAITDSAMLVQACCNFRGRIFASLDMRGGRLAVKGWRETSRVVVTDALQRFQEAGAAAVILTDITRDGTESGVDAENYAALARSLSVPLIASGGVARLDDVVALRQLFDRGVAGVIAGRALYEGRFTLRDAIAAVG